MLRFRRLRTRIIAAFAILVALVQAIAFALVNVANEHNAQAKIGHELAVGERIFRRLLEDKRAQLIQTASLLAADATLRAAAGGRDAAPFEAALRDHGSRIGADLMLLLDA